MRIKQSMPVLALTSLIFTSASMIGLSVYAGDEVEGAITPFERVVTIPAVKNRNIVDHRATYEKAQDVAFAIGNYVATFDESILPGIASNWVLGGFEGDVTVEEAILEVPTPWYVIPDDTTSGVKKVSLVEMCNRTFASVALGVEPVVDGDDSTKITNGVIHAPALPCEVSVYSDGPNIKVDMLNAEAIFTLFFTDVLFGEQMNNQDFVQAIFELPTQVKWEIQTIIMAALDHAGIEYEVEIETKGPVYETLDEVVDAVLVSPQESPFVHFTYTKTDGTSFSKGDVGHVAQMIINTMTINEQDGAGDHTNLDLHCGYGDGTCLEDYLSDDSKWRAARPTPLSMPGVNKVIEACSPKYAKLAMSTGLHHATALPCEIAVNKIDDDNTLLISFLDPHFMFTALFSDAFKDMTEEELEDFAELPGLVLGDLQTIVKYAIDYNLDFGLDPKGEDPQGQVWYDMLPHLH
jgi:uncharacterized protein (DUF302 family)